MSEYPKTDNLFTRNPDTHKLNIGDFRSEAVPQIKKWLITEKLDGTNIRVCLNWAYGPEFPRSEELFPNVSVRGRSDAASLPGNFVKEAFGVADPSELTPKMLQVACDLLGCDHASLVADPISVVIYGEGYGAGIQKVGKRYSSTKRFRAFDVVTTKVFEDTGTYWRSWGEVEIAAFMLGVETVPFLGHSELGSILKYVGGSTFTTLRRERPADVELAPIEGVVARTNPYLFDSRGKRVMFKLKGCDL